MSPLLVYVVVDPDLLQPRKLRIRQNIVWWTDAFCNRFSTNTKRDKWQCCVCVLIETCSYKYNKCLMYKTWFSTFRRVREFARTTISVFMLVGLSVLPSVRPSLRMEQIGFRLKDFHEIWYLSSFKKSIEKIQISLKFYKNNVYITWRAISIFLSYIARFFLEWEMFKTNFAEKIKTHILCSIISSRKSSPLWDVEKYDGAGQATDENLIWRKCCVCG